MLVMDVLFRRTYTYKNIDSFEAAKERLVSVFNKKKWYDITKDISGEIDDDGAFSFRANYYFTSLVRSVQKVFLNGNLIKEGDSASIRITISPNLALVFAIYLIMLLSLNILFGDNSILGHNGKLSNFLLLLFFELVLFAFIQINSFLLRRKFEKLMGISLNP